jgi:hypothetical protein
MGGNMIRIIFALLLSLSAVSNASVKDITVHQKAVGKQHIALSVKYFDDDILDVLIPKDLWTRVLYKATGANVRERSRYITLTESFYRKGVYNFRLAKPPKGFNQKSKDELKALLSHYLIAKVTVEMLGYESFEQFKEKNIDCRTSNGSLLYECKLKPESLINVWQASNIMAENGFLVNTTGRLDLSNVSFISQ